MPKLSFSGIAGSVGGFLLRHWVWFALAGALLCARHYQGQSAGLTTQLSAVTSERDTAVQRATEWKAAVEADRALAEKTAAAHADETNRLIDLARSAGAAKQGIANAPGAADRFRYSDAAYGFMRARPAQAAGGAGQAASDLGGR
jgi:hypothetical protein